MSITCDYRESKCIEYFNETSIQHTVENLVNGDFIITNSLNTKRYVIERKSMDDLSSSIVDGRYKDQISRLSSIKSENTSIMFIIEGFNKNSKKGVPYSTLLSTMQSIVVKYGIYVMRSKDIKETCKIVQLISKKIDDTIDIGDTSFQVCKKSHTLSDVYISMLMSIPGISHLLANSIKENFETLPILCKKLEESGHTILSTIPKIGNKKSLTIYKYIMYED
jgi:ERCC4-type nuclease